MTFTRATREHLVSFVLGFLSALVLAFLWGLALVMLWPMIHQAPWPAIGPDAFAAAIRTRVFDAVTGSATGVVAAYLYSKPLKLGGISNVCMFVLGAGLSFCVSQLEGYSLQHLGRLIETPALYFVSAFILVVAFLQRKSRALAKQI
jgi:hypothetical protein